MRRLGVVVTAVVTASFTLCGSAGAVTLSAVERDEVRAHPHALVLARDPRAVAALRRAKAVQVARTIPIWRVQSGTALRLAPLAELVEADRFIPVRSHFGPPPDPLVPDQWWIGAIRADAAEPPGPGKPVTVIDTGIDTTHEEFAGRPATTLLNSQFVVGQAEEHGTAVVSALGAPLNGRGLVGVYPQAALQIWDATPSGPGIQVSNVIAGIDTAIRGGKSVINLSLGSSFNDPLLEAAVTAAFGTGSLVVAAAGNDRERGNPLEYPASLPHVLTVAATEQSGRTASFSSSSSFVDLAAPGQTIPVAVPGGYASFTGTSFAAPLVAGTAAWVWTARPGIDVTQLFDLMRATSQDIESPGFDTLSGFGRLDIPTALTAPVLPPDPLEPNEDLDHILARRLFRQAAPPLTAPGRLRASIRARLDSAEDPRDVYRVWVPGRRVTAISLSPTANIDLAVWGPRTVSVFEIGRQRRRDLRAVSQRSGTRRETARIRNTARRGAYYYVEAYPGGGAGAVRQVARLSYKLAISTAPIKT